MKTKKPNGKAVMKMLRSILVPLRTITEKVMCFPEVNTLIVTDGYRILLAGTRPSLPDGWKGAEVKSDDAFSTEQVFAHLSEEDHCRQVLSLIPKDWGGTDKETTTEIRKTTVPFWARRMKQGDNCFLDFVPLGSDMYDLRVGTPDDSDIRIDAALLAPFAGVEITVHVPKKDGDPLRISGDVFGTKVHAVIMPVKK